MPPPLSICVPAYNNPAGLSRLAESAQALVKSAGREAQVELCVSDDASPDPSGARAMKDRAWDMPVRVDLLEKNLGFSGNLIHAARMAQGDYLAFLGDDDVLAEDGFAKNLEELGHGDAIVFFRTMPDMPLATLGRAGSIAEPATEPATIASAAELPLKLGVFHASFIGNFVVRRDLFLSFLDEAEDSRSLYPHYAVLLRILDKHPARFVPRPWLAFNGGGSRWNQPLLTAVDLPRIYTRHFRGKPGARILPAFYDKQVRSIPRAFLNWRKGRKVDFGNPYQSLSLGNILACYGGSARHRLLAAAYWAAGRMLPAGMLERLLGRPRKTHFGGTA